MSMLDDLLDDYEAVAEAARRLERSRGHDDGDPKRCCEEDRCLRRDEAYVEAEADLKRALAKVAPRPFQLPPRHDLHGGACPKRRQEINNPRGRAMEYLQHFFSALDRLKIRESYYVSHAIGFPGERLCVLV